MERREEGRHAGPTVRNNMQTLSVKVEHRVFGGIHEEA